MKTLKEFLEEGNNVRDSERKDYGKREDRKKEANKKRRENDKKAVNEEAETCSACGCNPDSPEEGCGCTE
jgi:hypothetical protein